MALTGAPDRPDAWKPDAPTGLSRTVLDDFELVEPDEADQVPGAEQIFGPSWRPVDEEPSYFPPTDPVVIGEAVVCGFSRSSMDDIEVEASELDGQAGDEELAKAARQELRTDAATSTFDIDVIVEDRVAYLRGRVADIEDVENVEEVVGRLPQLIEVIEELDLASS